jgi:hypothetical protein
MGFYTGAVPEELERLKPEERRGVYRMLRLEVSASSDGTLQPFSKWVNLSEQGALSIQ